MRAEKAIDWRARLRTIQGQRRWRRIDVAVAIGVSLRTVENWTQGRNRPDKRARRALRLIWKEVVAELAAGAIEQAESNGEATANGD